MYKFAAVRSNQMTSRSRQAREPPRFVDFGLSACKFSVSQKESMMTSGHANRGGHPDETKNLLRANDPKLALVYTKKVVTPYCTQVPCRRGFGNCTVN